MGNTSCAPSIISAGVLKVVYNDGRVETYTRPIKTVELMLENPRQFVCEFGELKVGHKVQGLAADEDLQRRHLYFLLPIDMLYSMLTDEDMDALSNKACKAMKQGGVTIISKILPVLGDFCIFPSDTNTLNSSSTEDSEHVKRYSKQRSWRPALDTIIETLCRM